MMEMSSRPSISQSAHDAKQLLTRYGGQRPKHGNGAHVVLKLDTPLQP